MKLKEMYYRYMWKFQSAKINKFISLNYTANGPNCAVAKSSANELVGIGFASRYRLRGNYYKFSVVCHMNCFNWSFLFNYASDVETTFKTYTLNVF